MAHPLAVAWHKITIITKKYGSTIFQKIKNQGEVDQGLPLCYNCGVTGQVLSRPANILWHGFTSTQYYATYLTGENQADREYTSQ